MLNSFSNYQFQTSQEMQVNTIYISKTGRGPSVRLSSNPASSSSQQCCWCPAAAGPNLKGQKQFVDLQMACPAEHGGLGQRHLLRSCEELCLLGLLRSGWRTCELYQRWEMPVLPAIKHPTGPCGLFVTLAKHIIAN